jgi:phospholipase C
VGYLKAPAYQDGHAGYSNPLDEQTFLVNTINALQNSQYWKNTAVVIMYDDSDGWYDHQMPPIVNPSFNNTIISGSRVDILNGGGLCNYSGIGATGHGNQQGTGPTPMFPLNGTYAARMNGRCGYGTRMPFLLISPFAAQNVIDHTLTDLSYRSVHRG